MYRIVCFLFENYMECSQFILSENTMDFIVARDETQNPITEPTCIQIINEQYAVWYYDRSTLPPLSIERYSYSAIPKLFTIMDSTSLEVSGIIAMQNQPALSLKGQGILIGIADTGIDYTNDLFKNPDNTSRIFSIWDQGAENGGNSSENNQGQNNIEESQEFLYGRIYEKAQINAALASENPYEIVPQRDEIGHGTFLASIAAGNEDTANDFVGAAPQSELVVVKLKQAKTYLREFFFASKDAPMYQENDIMAAVAYLQSVAERENRPLVILIGLGSNQGSHVGMGPLSVYLNDIGAFRGRAVAIAAGNQGNARHHFFGHAGSVLTPTTVEINVEEDIEGFCMELWSYAPELVRVVVQSPTGQQTQGTFPIVQNTQTTNFVFENTRLTIDYRIAGRESGDLLIFFRFSNPVKGIWTLLVYPENAITGNFHIWLPIRSFNEPDVTFISPNPDTTITTPSTSFTPITTGGYNALTGAIYLESGRGFDGKGRIKPDFCAPCVEVSGAGLRNNYVTLTGTSVAAAITAGASALVLEWGILRENSPSMNSVEVKNFLIRGCERENNVSYPNTEWGYGKLDVYRAFEVLR